MVVVPRDNKIAGRSRYRTKDRAARNRLTIRPLFPEQMGYVSKNVFAMTTQNQGPPGRWLPRLLFEPIPLVITLIDHIDKLVSPILDASTLGVKRCCGIDDPTSPVSLREKIDMDHVVLSFRLSRARE
jgi:hypothetical protein